MLDVIRVRDLDALETQTDGHDCPYDSQYVDKRIACVCVERNSGSPDDKHEHDRTSGGTGL